MTKMMTMKMFVVGRIVGSMRRNGSGRRQRNCCPVSSHCRRIVVMLMPSGATILVVTIAMVVG